MASKSTIACTNSEAGKFRIPFQARLAAPGQGRTGRAPHASGEFSVRHRHLSVPLRTAARRLRILHCPHTASYTPHPAPLTLHPAPRTPHSASRTLHPALLTPHPALRTPHPASRTLHPVLRTRHSAPHLHSPAPLIRHPALTFPHFTLHTPALPQSRTRRSRAPPRRCKRFPSAAPRRRRFPGRTIPLQCRARDSGPWAPAPLALFTPSAAPGAASQGKACGHQAGL